MANISFLPGLSWSNLPQTQTRRLIDLEALRAGLASLRAEWVEAIGDDLSTVTVNLGALFDDFDRMIGGE